MTTDAAPGPDLAPFSAADLERRARSRLTLDLPPEALRASTITHGDHRIDGVALPAGIAPRAAAVLIGVRESAGEARVLMTLRASHLRDHSGQIALPGGKIDRVDRSPAAAAVREAFEEIGLDPGLVRPLGYLDPYLTGTGFLIVPTVALVREPVRLVPNPAEVDDVFEVPLAFLMDAANHERGSRTLGGRLRSFYVMAYGERRIWGVTAGVLRSLYDRLYAA